MVLTSAIFVGHAQECSTTAVGIHYVVPRGASIEIMTSGKFQAGIGLVYTSLTSEQKGETGYATDVELHTYGGVRVYHKEYRTAVYTNVGWMFGQLYGPRLFLSTKLMLLRNQTAFSIEPYYADKPGLRLGIYKLI